MIFWNTLLSGHKFEEWLISLIPDSENPPRFGNLAKKLDPFQTSMRDAKAISGWLNDVVQGVAINRGGNGNQAYLDLSRARLIESEDDEYVLTDLGQNVLSKWAEFGVNNNSDDDEFLRMVVLVLEAKQRQTTFYDELLQFWSEIRRVSEPLTVINNPESLYLMGLLSNTQDEFEPWETIKNLGLIFQAENNLDDLRAFYANSPEIVDRLNSIEVWLNNSARRATGRQRFCLAMECASRRLDQLSEIIESDNLSRLIGSTTWDSLNTVVSSYRLLNIGKVEGFKAQNTIFYGPPGTGKSTEAFQSIYQNHREVITFHPATDYPSFVGFYKPISKYNDDISSYEVLYEFQPQYFLRIYKKAWENLREPHYLLIEEINRGNCAKIFGDIFQILDREDDGFSKYLINVDADISSFLRKELNVEEYVGSISELYRVRNGLELEDPFSVIALPDNLSILATMNTSDQSLFPMDSAFKRRWNWKYVPIVIPNETIQLQIGEHNFDWFDFVVKVNEKILDITESEDKQIGTYFVQPIEGVIDIHTFVNKVLFYLWNDIFKDEDPQDKSNVFLRGNGDGSFERVVYSELYNGGEINVDEVFSLLRSNEITQIEEQ